MGIIFILVKIRPHSMIIEHLIGTTTIEVPDIETVVTMEQIIHKENGKIIDGKISLSE